MEKLCNKATSINKKLLLLVDFECSSLDVEELSTTVYCVLSMVTVIASSSGD